MIRNKGLLVMVIDKRQVKRLAAYYFFGGKEVNKV